MQLLTDAHQSEYGTQHLFVFCTVMCACTHIREHNLGQCDESVWSIACTLNDTSSGGECNGNGNCNCDRYNLPLSWCSCIMQCPHTHTHKHITKIDL